MSFTVAESPWVTLRRGDPSFQLQGPYTLADRAYIEITNDCPRGYLEPLANAINQGWIKSVATVPKDDPTLVWETLKR
jgi:hypothetical protein